MSGTTSNRNYLGALMPLSPTPTSYVYGTAPSQALKGNKGVSNFIVSDGGISTLIGGDRGDTFGVRNSADVVIVGPSSGINTVVSWTNYFRLPSNVQNLILEGNGGVGVGNFMDNLLQARGTGVFTLVAGTGNDVLVGNGNITGLVTGGRTNFVIAAGDGNDVISNFENGTDTVSLQNFSAFTSVATLRAAMTQVGQDVVLRLAPAETLTFRNETISQLAVSNFQITASLPSMTLRFDDEFNTFTSSPYGTSGWMTQGGAVWRTLPSNHEAEYYSDSSVGVNPFSNSGGVLTISASSAKIPNALGLPYNSGIITTEKSLNFEYGVIEVNAKLPGGDGLWPAVWLLPADQTWPPEIDIMEKIGADPTQIYVGTHTQTASSANVGTSTSVYVGDTTQAFHTYAVDWEPATITWYFDGVKIFQEATPVSLQKPMYLLVNLAIGGAGSWPGAPTTAAEFSANMSIDWIRYYASASSTAISGTSILASSPSVTVTGADNAPAPAASVISGATVTSTGTIVKAGATVLISLTFTAGVNISNGIPTITLNDGGVATYKCGSGTPVLVFSYAVASGQNTSALAFAIANAIALNGATVRNLAGNPLTVPSGDGLTLAAVIKVDTTPPVLSAIAMTAATAVVRAGGTVTFTATFSEPIYVTSGVPTVTLNDGGTATYVSGSGTSRLVLSYTVQAGQNTAALGFAATGALNLYEATLADVAGNTPVNLSVDGYFPSGTVAVAGGPVVLQVAVSGSSNTYSPGSGTFIVTGSTSGSMVTLGDGSQTVTVTGTGDKVTVGAGNQVVSLTGTDNSVTTGAGTSVVTIKGDNAKIIVGATATGTTQVTAIGIGEHVTSTGSGNITVIGPSGSSTVNLADGNATVTLGGAGNKVTVGRGVSLITTGAGGLATIHAGGGSDTIATLGFGNLLDAGAGMNFLHGGSGSDVFMLNGPDEGLDTVYGFTLTNKDVLDLSRTVANDTSKADMSSIMQFVSATAAGGNTILYIDPTGGHKTPYAFALLQGVTVTMPQLISHTSIRF